MAKILFCLPSAESAFSVCERVLRELGHEVLPFYYRTLSRPCLGVASRIRHRIQHSDYISKMNELLIVEVQSFRPDILLVFKGELLFAETIRRISRDIGVRTASYYVDSPLWVDNSTLQIMNGIQFFDVAFVFDGHYIPELKRLGCPRVEVLSFCCDPTIHRPMDLSPEERRKYGSKVCFVGNYQGVYCQREKVLESLQEFDLRIWGLGWDKSRNPALRAQWSGRAASGVDMARVYSASEVTINVTYPHSITQPNMRTFEAPACGIIMINDDVDGIPKFFKIGQELEVYRDLFDLKSKVRYYLDHPEERSRIAEAGRVRAQGEHTYHLRMRQMMDCIMEGLVS